MTKNSEINNNLEEFEESETDNNTECDKMDNDTECEYSDNYIIKAIATIVYYRHKYEYDIDVPYYIVKDQLSTYYDVYEHDSIERYRALEIFLKNICVSANGKCCISHLTFDDLENAGARHSDTEGFVNYARQLDGVDIGAFLAFNKIYS